VRNATPNDICLDELQKKNFSFVDDASDLAKRHLLSDGIKEDIKDNVDISYRSDNDLIFFTVISTKYLFQLWKIVNSQRKFSIFLQFL
jgi:hypothetical protein